MTNEELQKKIEELEFKLNKFDRPASFTFMKTVQFMGKKLGFFGSTPVSQPSSTGESLGHSSIGGTTVTHSDTWRGNVGSTSYTINDIVKHLKNIGILAE